ncbi:MAG TPA: hypothetical protein VFQ53_00100 [Kofleriaceae bacterium]|nr:hypothetical protein [Kofleriaceae bacterium]
MRSLAFAIVLAACGTDPPAQGELTHATCPPVDPPTYAGFGAPFFTSYCNRCHSETLTGAARQGAPVTIDFDTESLVRENTSRIDRQAAFGPDAMNTLMPIGAPLPSDEERLRLGEFIACEVAR